MKQIVCGDNTLVHVGTTQHLYRGTLPHELEKTEHTKKNVIHSKKKMGLYFLF